MKKAMFAYLVPVEGAENEWVCEKAEGLFAGDPDWRDTLIKQTAPTHGWDLSGRDFSTIRGLCELCVLKPAVLFAGCYILDDFQGCVRSLPEGAVVMGDESGAPKVIVWEENVSELFS